MGRVKSRKYYSGQQAALGAVNGYIEETVTAGDPFVKPEAPVKEGNYLAGWVDGEGNFMTADVQKGQLAVGMKDNPKFLMIASKLTEADVTKAEVNGNTYKLYLKDCNRPQKDGSNALNRVTNDFITKDEVAKGVADGLGSLGNLVTINSLDVDFTGILLTAVVENNTLKSVKLSYTMTVNSLKLKALVVNVNGNGAGKMECTYTFA